MNPTLKENQAALQALVTRFGGLEQALAYLHYLEAGIGASSLIEWVHRLTPQWAEPTHLQPIAALFAAAEFGPVRACVSVPPRHGKTELLLHAIPWWLHRHPYDTIGYASYAGEFAYAKSRRAMELTTRSGLIMRANEAKASLWRTKEGGGLLATGIGGALTGHGLNLLLVDDPIKNREEAESPTYRRRMFEWFTSTAMTRLEPKGSCIVVHTRWHDDDLIGRLLREQPGLWENINLPAIDDNGLVLWPSRWPRAELDARRRDVGEYDWWSMFQGEPRPRGGRLFGEPHYYEEPQTEGVRIMAFCDPAASEKTHADYSVVGVLAAWRGPDKLLRMDVLEVYRQQLEMPRIAALLARVCTKWKCPVGVEAVGGFKGVPQMLRQMVPGLPILEITPTKDKFTRALPCAAAWNDGRIRLPYPHKQAWVPPMINEFASFTGISDPHDDQVDMLVHGFNTFNQAKVTQRGQAVVPWAVR